MSISSRPPLRSTVLPPPDNDAVSRGVSLRPTLKPLCPVRMAEASRAEEEIAALCEEISQVVRKVPRVPSNNPAKASRPGGPRAQRKVAAR